MWRETEARREVAADALGVEVITRREPARNIGGSGRKVSVGDKN